MSATAEHFAESDRRDDLRAANERIAFLEMHNRSILATIRELRQALADANEHIAALEDKAEKAKP